MRALLAGTPIFFFSLWKRVHFMPGAQSEVTDEGMRRESGSGKGVVVGCVLGRMMAD